MKATQTSGKEYPRLKTSDLVDGDVVILTIAGYEERTLPNGDLIRDLFFSDADKPLRLNKTQVKYLVDGLGSDESDDWKGCIIPVEKTEKEGPDGNMHDVVWVSPPEMWASLFQEAGMKPPAHQSAPARRSVAAKPASVKGRGRKAAVTGKAVKRRGR